MRVGVHGLQNGHPGTGDPQVGGPQLRRRHIRVSATTATSWPFLDSVKTVSGRSARAVGCVPVPFNTVALELVPPNTDRSRDERLDEARKVDAALGARPACRRSAT